VATIFLTTSSRLIRFLREQQEDEPGAELGFSSEGNTSSDIPNLAQDIRILLFVDAFVSSIAFWSLNM
jgi:hypothetical protein